MASTKHFIIDPTHLVQSALHSLSLTNPSLSVDLTNKIVYRSSPTPNTISLISGGGSGHEPSFSSFVGRGLLTAAVAGTIFASPSAEQIRNAILHRVEVTKGVLVVVMNYTGDILNFGMGVEKARAQGMQVEMVVVADDAGVGREKGGKVGRRGIAGTCLVLKIAGAAAEVGVGLEDTARVARLVADNVVSVGASLSHVHVPGRDLSTDDEMAEGEVEVGMGIHNEPGSERVKMDLIGLVKKMLAQMLDPLDRDRNFLNVSKDDKTILLVNNLGGISVLELGGITDEVVKQLKNDYGIEPVRILAGTYMTSLNGIGFSISLLKLRDTGLGHGKSMLELLDTPVEATGWSATVNTNTWESKSTLSPTKIQRIQDPDEVKPSNLRIDYAYSRKILETALNRLIAAEPDVTNYDTIVGDGDCGIGLKRGAEALLKNLELSKPTSDVTVLMHRIIQVVEKTMDGTSGAIYTIFLNALAHGLRNQDPSNPEDVTVGMWAKALESSMVSLGKYTPARPGDRTLVDALYPFVGTLSKTGSVQRAAEAAQEGAQKTKGMKASLGRTVYVGGEGWKDVPDPGAYGLSEFLQGLSNGLK